MLFQLSPWSLGVTDSPTPPFALSALRVDGASFQALIEHSADLITLLDGQGRILYQSPSARYHLGCDRNPTAEKSHVNLDHLHPADRDRIEQQVLHAPPGLVLTLSPYRIQHADGSWRWLEGTAINLLEDESVAAIVVQARDVTVRLLAEQRARALEGLSTALASANRTSEVVEVILLQGLEMVGAVAGGVLLQDSSGAQMHVLGSAGYPERVERPWRHFPTSASTPATDAIREGRDLFLTREDWCLLYPDLQHLQVPTAGSFAVLTLRVNGSVKGAITLSFREDRVPGETERRYLRTVAAQCALAWSGAN